MLIISFTWTTAAFIAGAKTCTRRHWNDAYAQRFHAGTIAQGWDRGPRNGGQLQSLLQLTTKPYKENTADMPEEDFEKEGLGWMERHQILIKGMTPREFWDSWKAAYETVYVVRFVKLPELPGMFYETPGFKC
jgi:hypothetical protein